tara:strand:- start:824 stop:1396 length:573 start_codon:yes stop_codon:yes gene_type:complete
MKTLITILILTFSLQSFTKADDIRDIEIEGMSVGDSLLDFISKKEIEKNILPYFENKRKYYVVYYNKNLSFFNDFEIYLKSDDDKYIVRMINAGLYPKNLNECKSKQKELIEEVENSNNELEFFDYELKHTYYTNTTVHGAAINSSNYYMTVECLFFHSLDKKKHPKLIDNLALIIKSQEVEDWIMSGYQ